MNYYKRHIGDYAKKAGHLSVLEHGVYTLLLDVYYDREQAPTEAEAFRWARARSPEETHAVSVCLAEFFVLRDGRYFQQRVEDELDAARAICERNRNNGQLGGRKPRERKTERLANGNPDERQSTNPLIHDLKAKGHSAPALVLPDWLPSGAWQDWHVFRNVRKGWTPKARELSLRTLDKLRLAGHNPQAVIEQSIERGWTGLFEVKTDARQSGGSPSAPARSPDGPSPIITGDAAKHREREALAAMQRQHKELGL